MNEIYNTVKFLKDEIHCLKKELEASNSNLAVVKAENERLKQAFTLTNFKVDSLEHYGRRENLRFHNIPVTETNTDDGENEVLEVANALNIKLTNFEIQRAVVKVENFSYRYYARQKLQTVVEIKYFFCSC